MSQCTNYLNKSELKANQHVVKMLNTEINGTSEVEER